MKVAACPVTRLTLVLQSNTAQFVTHSDMSYWQTAVAGILGWRYGDRAWSYPCGSNLVSCIPFFLLQKRNEVISFHRHESVFQARKVLPTCILYFEVVTIKSALYNYECGKRSHRPDSGSQSMPAREVSRAPTTPGAGLVLYDSRATSGMC